MTSTVISRCGRASQSPAVAQTLHLLMTGVLGYQRYGAFGGDIGGVVTGWLGALYPQQVAGIHMLVDKYRE